MQNLRGAYMCFAHDRKEDWDFLRDWQPNVIRVMLQGSHSDPNSISVSLIERIHRTCPDALIVLRCWDLDDRNFQAHEAMVADPIAEANKQVDFWAQVIARTNVPRHQLIGGLANEVDPTRHAALFIFTRRALFYGTQLNIRLGVGVFSTGTPHLPGDGEYDITKFATLDPLVVAGDHIWLFHEYLQPEGMYAVWTDAEGRERKDYSYLIGRHKRWPIQGKVIIGEWGIEGILYNRHRDPQWGNAGWLNFKELWPPTRYADEYVACVEDAAPNVIGICPYLGDYADHRWQSADLLPAYGEFLKRKHLCVKDSAQPTTVHLPQIDNGPSVPVEEPKPMATGIIDPRVAQAILKIESGGRTHGSDGKIIIRFEAHIFKTYLKNDVLWAQYFSVDPVKPWTNQQWRRDAGSPVWAQLHTGNQADEWAAFDFACSLNTEAACNSISVGAAQIMGFNHARVGYPTAQAMFESFQSAPMQTIGFINYCLSDAALIAGIRSKDWRTIARLYNGSGQVDYYAGLLESAYKGG